MAAPALSYDNIREFKGRTMAEDKAEYSANNTPTEETPFSQIPHWFFDELYPKVKSHYAKDILIVIARKTFGYHKDEDRISYTQFETATGLNRRNVARGIKEAAEYITVRKVGQASYYSVKPVTRSNQLQTVTSYTGEPVPVTRSNQLDEKPVTLCNTQKKEDLNKELNIKREGKTARAVTPAPKPVKPKDERASNPVIVFCREFMGEYPDKSLWDKLLCEVQDLEKFKRIAGCWVGTGFSKRNLNGMLDWYSRGIPAKYQGGGDKAQPIVNLDRIAQKLAQVAAMRDRIID